jgi:ComF family protein
VQEIMPGEACRDPIAAHAAAVTVKDLRGLHASRIALGTALVLPGTAGDKQAVNLAAPLRYALDFALPPRCPACGTIVSGEGSFCVGCWSRLDFLAGPACAACGLPLDCNPGEDVRCAACLAEPPHHDGVRAAVAYGEVARALALKLKHGRRIGMARIIGAHLARAADQEPGALLVPVPLHRWRIWRRGFNQSALIATEIARRTGIELRTDLLGRRKATPMLGGLGRAARKRTLRGAFAVPSDKRAALKGRTVLLVDDVYTSGATANGCARVLKRAGAARVVVLCWARVLQDHIDDEPPLGDGMG